MCFVNIHTIRITKQLHSFIYCAGVSAACPVSDHFVSYLLSVPSSDGECCGSWCAGACTGDYGSGGGGGMYSQVAKKKQAKQKLLE